MTIPADIYGKMQGAANLYKQGRPAGKSVTLYNIPNINPVSASRYFDKNQPDGLSLLGRKYALGVKNIRMPQPKLSANELAQMGVLCKRGATVRQALQQLERTDINPDNVRTYFDSSTFDGLTQKGRNHLPFKK